MEEEHGRRNRGQSSGDAGQAAGNAVSAVSRFVAKAAADEKAYSENYRIPPMRGPYRALARCRFRPAEGSAVYPLRAALVSAAEQADAGLRLSVLYCGTACTAALLFSGRFTVFVLPPVLLYSAVRLIRGFAAKNTAYRCLRAAVPGTGVSASVCTASVSEFRSARCTNAYCRSRQKYFYRYYADGGHTEGICADRLDIAGGPVPQGHFNIYLVCGRVLLTSQRFGIAYGVPDTAPEKLLYGAGVFQSAPSGNTAFSGNVLTEEEKIRYGCPPAEEEDAGAGGNVPDGGAEPSGEPVFSGERKESASDPVPAAEKRMRAEPDGGADGAVRGHAAEAGKEESGHGFFSPHGRCGSDSELRGR